MEKFKIWYQTFDENGNLTGTGVYHKEYVNYGTAIHRANVIYADMPHVRYEVATLNPFEPHHTICTCDICKRPFETPINPTFGRKDRDGISIMSMSGAIPSNCRSGKTFHSYHYACPACITRVHGFIERMKEATDVWT